MYIDIISIDIICD